MSEARLLRFNEIPKIDRGRGIYSTPLIVEATGAKGKSEMRILWIYGSISVTRIYVETGEETSQFGRLVKG